MTSSAINLVHMILRAYSVMWIYYFKRGLDNKLSFNINKRVILQCKSSINTSVDMSYYINNRQQSKVTEHRDLCELSSL